MIKISNNINNLITYTPGKTIQELRRDYGLEKIAKLGSNENTLGPSPLAVQAMKDSLSEIEFYPEPTCIDVRDKFAKKLDCKRENIIVGNGSEGILNYIFKAFFSGDEELLTSEGTFIGVYVLAQAYNVKCNKISLKEGYKFDLDRILDNINDKTKAIYLANPNNPTGTIFSKEEFEAFMSKVPSNVLVFLDEAYYEFAYEVSPEYPVGTTYNYDNLITLRTFSKAYGLAGIRFGYGVASESLITALMKVKLPFEPSLVAQAAGMGAIEDTEFLTKTLDNYKIGLEYFYNEFEKLGLDYYKSSANFVMIDFETADRANELNGKLLERGVIVRPLPAFGLPHCIRITVGTPEENEMCIKHLKEVL